MNTKRGTVNGQPAVIDLDQQTFVPIIRERKVAEYVCGRCCTASTDPEDRLDWESLTGDHSVAIGYRAETKQTNFERMLWKE